MGRREQRAELESTWHVWDATRPLTRHDLAAPPPPAPETAAKREPTPHGGTLTLTDPNDVCEFERVDIQDLTEEQGVAIFGSNYFPWLSEIRCPRRRSGTVTVVGIDRGGPTISITNPDLDRLPMAVKP